MLGVFHTAFFRQPYSVFGHGRGVAAFNILPPETRQRLSGRLSLQERCLAITLTVVVTGPPPLDTIRRMRFTTQLRAALRVKSFKAAVISSNGGSGLLVISV